MSRTESFRSIKGTFDILPEPSSSDGTVIAGSAAWRFVEQTIAETMDRYGIREIRTPILEPTALIARGVGESTDIVTKEMFAFERGDTQYVLRPEVTAPVMRAYLQHSLDQQRSVQKLYYIGPCFRAERPQKGRYRQFHQFGVEYIGSDGVAADAEVIVLMIDTYRALGLTDCRLRLNTLGDESARPAFRDALVDFLRPHAPKLSETSARRLTENPLRILDTKNADERAILEDAPRLIDFVSGASRDRFERLKDLLGAQGVTFVEDPFLVRGLDYYTETAFELESDLLDGAQNSLAGGGRYDLLALEIGSKTAVPAVGFAAGMERLFLALQGSASALQRDAAPDLYIVVLGEEAERWASVTSRVLRQAGVRVEADLSARSAKAQMREANRLSARQVVVVGENELRSGVARLRDMANAEETDVRLDAEALKAGVASSLFVVNPEATR